MTEPLRVELELSPAALEAITAEVTRRVLAEIETHQGGRWLTGARQAASYLGWSPRRVYARLHEMPCHRDGGRVMFNTADLDDWVRRS